MGKKREAMRNLRPCHEDVLRYYRKQTKNVCIQTLFIAVDQALKLSSYLRINASARLQAAMVRTQEGNV